MRILLIIFIFISIPGWGQSRWSEAQAKAWYDQQPWLVGSNFIPSNAINELEMWQAESWDPAIIDRELGWAEKIGMNTMRVFLHDLLWNDPEAFKKRLNEFLTICEKHHIKPMLVIFDSVWDPNPKLGKQRDPKPGVHNSGWMQSPGAAIADEKQYPRLEKYVKGVVAAFAKDQRILAWDIWNEPDNVNTNIYQDPPNKVALIQKLLPQAFAWARSAHPVQPLTCGVWKMNLEAKEPNEFEKMQLKESDIISFHCYGDPATFEKYIKLMNAYNRPVICTEYLARGFKNNFETILPIGKKYKVGMINWGLVKGKTQTHLPWDSWQKPYVNGREPAVWHHEVFYPDGKPYKEEEVKVIRQLTSVK
ncbi:MAG: cellulase family glycosylhydrolase [Bacteroidetes bacterium]|nr:cellulase family glycosylhydrolase [Bacteroidota bacterium]